MTITVTDRGRNVKLRWRQVPGLAVVGALALSACAPDDDVASFTDEQQGETGSAEDSSEESEGSAEEEEDTETEDDDLNAGADDVLVAEVDDPVTFEECEEAEDADDATVTWLDDKVIEEQRHDGVEPETVQVDGDDVELEGAPAVVVPERIAQSGCIIEYEAPGACLSGFEISRAWIPGYTLPERVLPGAELPDGTVVEELVQEEVTVEAVDIDPVDVEQVCQDDEDAEDGDVVWGVTRWSETRWGETQWSETVWSQTRWSETTNSGDHIPTMSLDTLGSETLSMDTVTVDTETLDTYRLEGTDHTERSGEDESVSYTTEGDVLFDSSEYELRSDAESELQAVADDIAERDDDFIIKVEGHTDDVPVDHDQDFSDNDELSELRAESVAQWLTDNAGVDEGDITAEGLGEDHPRADNDTDEGRQLNRRVVITVQPEDYESSLDYELEEGEDED